MKIRGELKEKLDKACDETLKVFGFTKPQVASASVGEQFRFLHVAMTDKRMHPQNNTGNPMDSLMHEVYKTCNDDHLKTYIKDYLKR